MRLSILTVIIVLLSTYHSFGQVTLEVGGGPSFSTWTAIPNHLVDSPVERKRNHINSYYIFTNAGYDITKNLGVILELQYATGGYIDESGSSKSGVKRRHLVIAPKAQIKIIDLFDTFIGPYLGLAHNEKYLSGNVDWKDETYPSDLASTDYGIDFSIKTYLKRFSLSASVQYGIATLRDNVDRDGNKINSHLPQTRRYQIGLGYRIF